MAERGGGPCGCIFSLVVLGLAIFGGYTLYDRMSKDDQVVILDDPAADVTRTAIVSRATASASSGTGRRPANSQATSTTSPIETGVAQGNPCEGAAGWYRESIARSNEVVLETQSTIKTAVARGNQYTQAEMEIYLAFLQASLEAQAASDPPPAAAELQSAWLNYYQMNIDRAEAGLAGLPEPHSELDVTLASDNLGRLMEDFDKQCI